MPLEQFWVLKLLRRQMRLMVKLQDNLAFAISAAAGWLGQNNGSPRATVAGGQYIICVPFQCVHEALAE
eukprot:5703349-Amphidinium_carterae.1